VDVRPPAESACRTPATERVRRRRRTAAALIAPALAAPVLGFGAVVIGAGQAAAVPSLPSPPGHSAAAPAGTDGSGRPHRAGVLVSLGCSSGDGRCWTSVVICSDRGPLSQVISLIGYGQARPASGLTVRVGGPCGPKPPPATPPPGPPPPTPPAPPTPPTTPTPPVPAPPTATAPAAGAPAPRPGPVPSASPAQPAGSTTRPRPAALVLPSPGPPAKPSGAPSATPAATPSHSGPPASTSQAAVLPVAQEPSGTYPDDAERWWLLSMMAVLLPAVLAALPRATDRRR
jgi:hypothetical protein